jgi:Flp pilus assembly protein TadG
MHTLFQQLRRDVAGVAALEFAIVAPFLILVLLGTVELYNEITSGRRVQQASYSIAQIISEAPNPPGAVDYQDLQMAHDSAMIVFPLVLGDSASKGINWSKDISITISSIVVTQDPTCAGNANCQYIANVAWTWGDAKRPCSVNLQKAADTSDPSPTTLPSDAFAPGSLIVADVSYHYTPVIFGGIVHSINYTRSTYLEPRNVQPTSYIQYDQIAGDPGATTICPARPPSNSGGNNSGGNSSGGNGSGSNNSGGNGSGGNSSGGDSSGGNNSGGNPPHHHHHDHHNNF